MCLNQLRLHLKKFYLLCGLNKKNLFLRVWEAGKSRIKALANSVPGEGSFRGLHTSTFLLCLEMAERGTGEGAEGEEREEESSGLLFFL